MIGRSEPRWGRRFHLPALIGIDHSWIRYLGRPDPPAVELERAITQEQVDGDLKAAIAAYQKIAGDTSAPRDVRAKALLRLAACYEKLGRQPATCTSRSCATTPTSPPARQARTRLAALKKETAGDAAKGTARKIETAGRNFGPPNTDGQRVVYWDKAPARSSTATWPAAPRK